MRGIKPISVVFGAHTVTSSQMTCFRQCGVILVSWLFCYFTTLYQL